MVNSLLLEQDNFFQGGIRLALTSTGSVQTLRERLLAYDQRHQKQGLKVATGRGKDSNRL